MLGEMHKDEYLDLSDKKRADDDLMWDDMVEMNYSLDAIRTAVIDFQDKFHENYYHSDKEEVSERMTRLNEMVEELVDEITFFHAKVDEYY